MLNLKQYPISITSRSYSLGKIQFLMSRESLLNYLMSFTTNWSLCGRLETRDITSNYAETIILRRHQQLANDSSCGDGIVLISPCMVILFGLWSIVVIFEVAYLSVILIYQSMEAYILSHSYCNGQKRRFIWIAGTSFLH